MYGARSFLNQSDFFYVLQEADFHANPRATDNSGDTTTTLALPATNPVILQPSPQTTMSTTSLTSGVSTTIGGSIGFNEAQGFNASLSASTTISNSMTTTYPPIDILNSVNLATGVADFIYGVATPSQAAGSTLTFFYQWIWQVPFTAYAGGQTSIEFATTSGLFVTNERNIPPAVSASLTSTVPTPFGDVFALQTPVVKCVMAPRDGFGRAGRLGGRQVYDHRDGFLSLPGDGRARRRRSAAGGQLLDGR